MKKTAAVVGVLVCQLVLGGYLLAEASASPSGYLRLAHLSPDTPRVDVYLDGPGDDEATKVPGVGYGVVSDYLTLPVGTYTIAMRPEGTSASAPAVVSTDVRIESGKAVTVAGMGALAHLHLEVLVDDLSQPAPGKAAVRVIHASAKLGTADVRVGGRQLATNAGLGDTTSYRDLPVGKVELTAKSLSGGPRLSESLRLEPGTVYSLAVLDNPAGGVRLRTLVDAAGLERAPTGGAHAGYGGLAEPAAPSDRVGSGLASVAGLVVAVLAGTALLLRRGTTAR